MGIGAKTNEPRFVDCVGILNGKGTRIFERQRRVGERDTVLLEIRSRLGMIPLVLHYNASMYVCTPTSSPRAMDNQYGGHPTTRSFLAREAALFLAHLPVLRLIVAHRFNADGFGSNAYARKIWILLRLIHRGGHPVRHPPAHASLAKYQGVGYRTLVRLQPASIPTPPKQGRSEFHVRSQRRPAIRSRPDPQYREMPLPARYRRWPRTCVA